jgi:hypothetical protein
VRAVVQEDVVGAHRDYFKDMFWLRPAQDNGDWETLAQYIERGSEITSAMRKFIAGVLRGQIKRPRGRPRKAEIDERAEAIAWFVHEARQKAKQEGARAPKIIEAAAKHFKVTTRTVQRAIARRWEWSPE